MFASRRIQPDYHLIKRVGKHHRNFCVIKACRGLQAVLCVQITSTAALSATIANNHYNLNDSNDT